MDTTQGMVPAGDAGEKQDDSSDLRWLAEELVERARVQGLNLVGPGGLLAGVTKQVVETALETEMAEHLGYEPHDPAGRNTGNSRNGRSEKTLQSDIGPVRVAVPRDRNGTFEPQLVAKGQRRLGGFNEAIISLFAKGLTTGDSGASAGDLRRGRVARARVEGHRCGRRGYG